MKVAVVTGAGRGLGRAVAVRLGQRGLAVLATDINKAAAKETSIIVGDNAWHMEQDVSKPGSHRAVAEAAKKRGDIAVWVNNAGVMRSAAAWEHSDEEDQLQIGVNVLGVIWGSKAAVLAMESGGGHIINIASISALMPVPGLSVYAASKQAVLGYSVSLQGDIDRAKLPIRVSAICPDAINTDMVAGVAKKKEAALLFSANKMLEPDRVADVVVRVLDKPRLAITRPLGRATLAHLLRPFPSMSLKLLRHFEKVGEKHRAKRSNEE